MKNKVLIGFLLLVCILGCVLIFYSLRSNQVEKSDALRFHEEYNKVSEDNVFTYRSAEEIIKILENGTGVVYLGYPECQWCQAYVPMLNEVAKGIGLEKIYYYNIRDARKENTKEYQRIVELLQDNLLFDDEGNRRVYVPDVTVVKDGKILGHNNDSSVVTEEDGTPEEYWTDERKEKLQLELEDMMIQIVDSACTSCDE